jgi:hypothetical protein
MLFFTRWKFTSEPKETAVARAPIESGLLEAYLEEYRAVRAEIIAFEKLLHSTLSIYLTAIIALAGWTLGKLSSSIQPGFRVITLAEMLRGEQPLRFAFYMTPIIGSIVMLTAIVLAYTTWRISNYIAFDLTERIREAGLSSFRGFGWEHMQGEDKLLMFANGFPIALGVVFMFGLSGATSFATAGLRTASQLDSILWFAGVVTSLISFAFAVSLLVLSAINHPGRHM